MSRRNKNKKSGSPKTPGKPPTLQYPLFPHLPLEVGRPPTLEIVPGSPDQREDGARYFVRKYTPSASSDVMRDHVRGSIIWGAYGDACGMPFETQPPFMIYKHNRGWVTGLTDPKNSFERYLKLGGWTDDTQLKIAIMEAILEGQGVDLDLIAKHHVRMLKLGARGWGGSTRDSVALLQKGVGWKASGKVGGAGNGVAMKISPIGILYGIRDSESIKAGQFHWRELANTARKVAIMTHRDPRAVVSGILHSILVALIINGVDPLGKWDRILEVVRKIEDLLPPETENLSERLEMIEPNLNRDCEYFAHLFRTGCFVVESYPFAVATYMLYRKDVHGGILAAVNAGGDCDSTASMVGDLCGAEAGLGTEVQTLALEEHDQLLGLTDDYYDLCAGGPSGM